VRKTTIAIDDELVAQAAAALGTRGISPTVHRALEDVVRRALIERSIERFKTLTLDDLTMMKDAWRRHS
jgi:Arc/MetJ family transcription regulator